MNTIVLYQKENGYLANALKFHVFTNFFDQKYIKKFLERKQKTANVNQFTIVWLFLPSNPVMAKWAYLWVAYPRSLFCISKIVSLSKGKAFTRRVLQICNSNVHINIPGRSWGHLSGVSVSFCMVQMIAYRGVL